MINELLFILIAFSVFFFVFCCFFWGRRWLHAAIAVNLIAISVFGVEVVAAFGMVTNVGNIFYAAVFFAGQLLVEHYGKKEGKKSLWLGFTYVLFFIMVAQIVIRYIPIQESIHAASAIHYLFSSTPRVAMASLLAYLCSQSLNLWLYGHMRSIRPRQIWLRVVMANFFGQGIDSVIFFTLAFVGTVSGGLLFNIIVTGFSVKFIAGLLAIPFAYLSHRIKGSKEILEQEAEAMISGISDGIVMTDDQGKVILINKAFTQMLGWKEGEVLGKNIGSVLERQDEEGRRIDTAQLIISQVLAGKKVSTTIANHSYFVRRNRTKFPVVITVTPVFVDDKIIGAVEVFRDITKEKEIDKMRTDFVSLASHQLRTPLSGMRWIIETLMDGTVGTVNAKQKDYLKDLYRMNNRLIQLVSDMLSVLHLQSGTIKINKEVFGLDKFYREIEITNRDAARKKHIAIETNLTRKPVAKIKTDFRLAKTIIDSFLSNAINYSEPGTTIQVNYRSSKQETVISVQDSGIGIPKDEQRRMFEKFYRASNAQQMNASGTGLGLYIANSLAEKIGAKTTFKSIEGKGSTFYLAIPKKA